jgi:hypothetical protein
MQRRTTAIMQVSRNACKKIYGHETLQQKLEERARKRGCRKERQKRWKGKEMRKGSDNY